MGDPPNGVSSGTAKTCFSGWFREDSRLIYADHLVYVELKGSKFTVYDEPGAEPSIEMNIKGGEMLCREKNYKIVIETSQTKVRLYAVNLHEYMNWCSVLRTTASGEAFDDSTEGFSFEKPLTSVLTGERGQATAFHRRKVSVDFERRPSSLDQMGRLRSASFDVESSDARPRPTFEKRKSGLMGIFKRKGNTKPGS
uniref:PH domain-containing protein n=1 Tax=Rhodosorus marinus TaxID=101924 RepID=A0A7S0BIB5_9RHOD|mmetsp:Transcript_16468/g.23812  ORF Transcript_16468/g.23812 Transcript_16468/m.23812 type:complete len:197 (+) Transcript_16468:246-836(+)